MLRVALASTLLVLTVGVAQAASDAPGTAAPVPSPEATLSQLVHDIAGPDASAGASRYRYLHKLDGHLQDVAASRLGGGTAESAIRAGRRQGVTTSSQGAVLVDVYVTGDVARAADELRALGMRVSAVSDRAPERMVEGYLPADALAAAAALGATHAIVSTIARVDAGSVISQGDAAIDGPQARALGATGAGASVGIISDSINEIGGGIAASQTSGNLPATVDDLLDDPNGVDEGRAMAEVVYDEAPGITHMAFSSGTLGPASKAASIDNLVHDGVTAIADDIEWLTEPYFQDDIIAQAVDRAKAAGVAYFASAANDANQSWQGTYAPVADPTLRSATTENFDPGGGVDTVQSVGTIPANGSVYLGLQWAEPWGRATTDLALDVYRFVRRRPGVRLHDRHGQHRDRHPHGDRGDRRRQQPADVRDRDPARRRDRHAVHEVHRLHERPRHREHRARHELGRDRARRRLGERGAHGCRVELHGAARRPSPSARAGP